ncbi:hypothetical protein RB594_000851 [Gaeumannomyces avenae]
MTMSTASSMYGGRSLFPGVAVITGAASGIGRQCATAFAREGCSRIALLDKDEDGMSETARLCKQASARAVMTFIIPCDVRVETEVATSLDEIIEEWGRIDYAVNSASVYFPGAAHRISPEEFDRAMSVSCRGAMISSREEIARMLLQGPLETHDGRAGNRGAIVNICSSGGIASRPSCPAYAASRAAIISLTRADAVEYAKDNIRINCVCSGVIDISAEIPDDDQFVAGTPMKRVGTSQEVADAVLFLCSSKATFIHGVALPVDGGYTAC